MTPITGLKNGWTTGACAQAAAKAAAIMFSTQQALKSVTVETPSGIKLRLEIIEPEINKDSAKCAVVKDSGDEPDVTNGVKIYAEVQFSSCKGISITGGQGVGRVTRPGLAIGVGEYAINPVPRKMITRELLPYLPEDSGLEVIISVPTGEELAKRTFNPSLGITGGISIIGTTGIVVPKSLDAYKSSLSLRLDVLKAAGHKKATLVFGYVGERFCQGTPGINGDSIIRIGDYAGFMIEECARKKINQVLLIGHIGKLIKIACGQFNTHNKFGDNRINAIADYACRNGADRETICRILQETSSEGTILILKKNGLTKIFKRIAADAVQRLSALVDGEIEIECVVLSLQGEVLGTHTAKKQNFDE